MDDRDVMCEVGKSGRDDVLDSIDVVISDALRNLPEIRPAEDLWPKVRRRLLVQRRRRRAQLIGVAAAAVVVMGLAVGALVRERTTATDEYESLVVVSDPDLVGLMEASRRLELVLQAPEVRDRVLDSRRTLVILELEDRIAAVDGALSVAASKNNTVERDLALWAGRVELLDTLVRVRGDRVATNGVTHAVNTDEWRHHE